MKTTKKPAPRRAGNANRAKRALSKRLWAALGDDLEALETFVNLLESVSGRHVTRLG